MVLKSIKKKKEKKKRRVVPLQVSLAATFDQNQLKFWPQWFKMS